MTDLILPWAKPPLTGNRTRGNPHARANEVKQALTEARATIADAQLLPVQCAYITLHLQLATRHRRDADGMFPTLKVVQDALVLEGVLPDDSWVHVPRAACEIHPPAGGQDSLMWVAIDAPVSVPA